MITSLCAEDLRRTVKLAHLRCCLPYSMSRFFVNHVELAIILDNPCQPQLHVVENLLSSLNVFRDVYHVIAL